VNKYIKRWLQTLQSSPEGYVVAGYSAASKKVESYYQLKKVIWAKSKTSDQELMALKQEES